MKRQLILVLLCLSSQSKADMIHVTSLSGTNSGLFIAISGAQSNTKGAVSFDKRLVWLPFCGTNTAGALIELQFPNARYGMKMKMTDPNGKEVSKTDLGDIWCSGANWNRLQSYKDGSLTSVFAAGPYQPDLGAEGGQFLPAPNDLFKMAEPGIYNLEIQMQMFIHTNSIEPKDWQRNLIRFSVIKVKVVKP